MIQNHKKMCYHKTMKTNSYIFQQLKKSKFRNSFHLKQKDFDYINIKGLEKIGSHAKDFVNKNLVDVRKFNDGKQTPMHGHPVFIAQHATATCCRECLYKWHKIEKNHVLTKEECEYISKIIMTWIEIEIGAKEKKNG